MRLLLKLAAVIAAGVLALAALPTLGLGSLLGGFNPFQTETIDRSQPALLVSVQELEQYHAAAGSFEVILDQEEDVNYVPDFLAGERSLFVAAGTVNAYVDLSGLGHGDLRLSDDGTSVTIRLPEAELDKPNLDQERSYLYSQDRGVVDRIGDAISAPDQSDLYQDAERMLADAAAESDLKDQAAANTRAMLTGMFSSLDLDVTFADQPAAG